MTDTNAGQETKPHRHIMCRPRPIALSVIVLLGGAGLAWRMLTGIPDSTASTSSTHALQTPATHRSVQKSTTTYGLDRPLDHEPLHLASYPGAMLIRRFTRQRDGLVHEVSTWQVRGSSLANLTQFYIRQAKRAKFQQVSATVDQPPHNAHRGLRTLTFIPANVPRIDRVLTVSLAKTEQAIRVTVWLRQEAETG